MYATGVGDTFSRAADGSVEHQRTTFHDPAAPATLANYRLKPADFVQNPTVTGGHDQY
jgi:hypothetical protein